MTALQVAELRGHRAVADLLRASGAGPAAAEQGSVALSMELEQALAAGGGAAGSATAIHAALRRCAPIIGTTACTIATRKARISEK